LHSYSRSDLADLSPTICSHEKRADVRPYQHLRAETLTYFPIAYLALRPMLASISSSFEEASFSLGGSRWHAFQTVTIR